MPVPEYTPLILLDILASAEINIYLILKLVLQISALEFIKTNTGILVFDNDNIIIYVIIHVIKS